MCRAGIYDRPIESSKFPFWSRTISGRMAILEPDQLDTDDDGPWQMSICRNWIPAVLPGGVSFVDWVDKFGWDKQSDDPINATIHQFLNLSSAFGRIRASIAAGRR